jgi:beta-phosphoglucomutase family hydrolase
MIKAVIFDMDGVLISSKELHTEAWIKCLQEFNIIVKEYKYVTGISSIDVAQKYKQKYNLLASPEEISNKKVNIYNTLAEKTELILGVVEFIRNIQTKYKLSLATSEYSKTTNIILSKHNLDKYFDLVVTVDDINQPKPNPEIYLKTAKELKLKPSECIVIEDSVVGVEAAKSAGMKCIAITTTTPRSKLKQADLIVDSFKEIDITNL